MRAQGIGLQITRYYSALGKPVPKNVEVGSTTYSTPVLCSARQYTGNVVDQTTSTVTVT
jgi:hypothetical protein